MKYKLQIRIGTTNCRKGRDDGKDLSAECDLNNVSFHMFYHWLSTFIFNSCLSNISSNFILG